MANYPVFSDEYFMNEALKEAQIAYNEGEIPVGAIIVADNTIIAKAHNQSEVLNDFTAHAEMIAFTSASEYFGGKYLTECTLYVTLEPCIMCAGGAYWTQLGKIVWGALDLKKGYTTYKPSPLHPSTLVKRHVLEYECASILNDFFAKKRQ